ncbi:MAG: patatin-like phospholipase family protein [Acidobacteriia bacterium]|nr:patatin-like phospholipase family protein [Terriglobia bacterium]
MTTAVVFSAGGMYGAWEAGVWKALAGHIRFDVIAGASAGAWNGWAIAGGATPEELANYWLDASVASIRILRAQPLHQNARDLFSRFRPRLPFGLTVVEMPRFRERLIRDSEITWRHLAATCSIPGVFPPVRINGRFYVDGGLLNLLPLWAAAEMGAARAIGINCLTGFPSKILNRVLRPKHRGLEIPFQTITPSERLGSLRDSLYWSRPKIERWLELGERDGKAALSSITM